MELVMPLIHFLELLAQQQVIVMLVNTVISDIENVCYSKR